MAFVTGEILVPVSPVREELIPEYNSSTLDKWRDSTEHLQWSIQQMKDPKFREMIGVLQNAILRIDPSILDPVKASYFLGQYSGMRTIVQIILMMSKIPDQPQQEVPADYSEPEEQIEITGE